MILGAFFYGYITTQILGGFLAPVIGAGRLFSFGVFITSLLTLITPVVANSTANIVPLITLRFLEGVFGVYSNSNNFLSRDCA